MYLQKVTLLLKNANIVRIIQNQRGPESIQNSVSTHLTLNMHVLTTLL